jgi:hypothetical protein
MTGLTMPSETLLERFAKRDDLAPEVARRRLVAEAFVWWHRPLVWVFSVGRPDLFRIDAALVEEMGRARTLAEAAHAVEIFRYRSRGENSWVRNSLGIRASGRQMLELARELLADDR